MIRFRVIAISLLLFLQIGKNNHVMSQKNLLLDWNIIHPVSKEIIHLGQKGSVQEAFIAANILPDPYIGLNENEFGWIEEHEWEFVSIFNYLPSDKEFVDVKFTSLDTYAEVYLNDTLVLKGDNSFKEYQVGIKNLLRSGENTFRIIFTPPTLYHKEMYDSASYKLPAPNDNNKISIAPYTRKPQYQFGWDWALRMVTIGLNKPAEIIEYNNNFVRAHSIQTHQLKDGNALIKVQLFLQNDSPIEGWKSALFGNIAFEQIGTLVTGTVQLSNPVLWWPRGQGEAYLYDDSWVVTSKSGSIIDSRALKFGVKTSELLQEKDQWGTSFELKVNGRNIFCKGGDYIPQDIFPARVKDEDVVKMVELMAASNFNIVRVWGGGYYPDEVFFKACDSLGIMVWQDFMFACAMYPGDASFLENVREELDQQIPRISSHPSVVLFNGNNEVDVAWKNWGFQLKYGLYGKNAQEIEDSYEALFKHLAPKRVETWSSIPYVHTSPLSNWGKDEFYNHGTQHYWGVWHGKDPMEDFGKKIGRFNAEFGFQSFPEYSTLLSFSEPKEWDLESEVMKHHQKSYVGNGMILKHAERLYGKPKDFEEFVYYSQLTQAKAVGVAVSGHRIDMPRCSGTIYWQLNDCWPGPTWSSVDYFGNWKALQYEVKKDFENVAILAKEEVINDQVYYLVSDIVDTFDCKVKCTIYTFDGKVHEVHEFDKKVFGKSVNSIPVERMIDPKLKEYVAHFEWSNAAGEIISRRFTRTIESRKAARQGSVQMELTKLNGRYELSITNSETLVDSWIYSPKYSFHLNQNFETLLPGNHRFEIPATIDLELKYISIKYR